MSNSNLLIPPSIADQLPSMVRNELANMPAQRQQEFIEEYRRKAKSVGVAYLFLILVFAMHYGYLRKWGLQVVFWITAGGAGLWWLIDLFRLNSVVKDYNKDVATDVMRNLKAISHPVHA